MYLISIYFDETSDLKIKSYIKCIAKETGNRYMLEGKVPPHITIAAFHAESEETALRIFRSGLDKMKSGEIFWVSPGALLPNVIYIAPLLDEYLHQLSVIYNKEIRKYKNVKLDERYQPFHWLPHTTLGKRLTKEELRVSFEVLQELFAPFKGKSAKIGLAKTNPHTDIEIFGL